MEDCRIIESLNSKDLEDDINYMLGRGWRLINVFAHGGAVYAALVRE